jgi:1,4-dihydroxy-2-naphthoyl-CoA synthase
VPEQCADWSAAAISGKLPDQQKLMETTMNDTNAPILLRDDRADGLTTLTLNRPSQFNSLSKDMLTAIQTELTAIAASESVRVVVLAGAGKAFCAGHDLKEMRANHSKEFMQALFRQCAELMLTITRMPQPVIARVHGIATAAGCQLVSMCDLAVAADVAKFAVSGINVGLFCSTPAVGLARNLGRKAALEMLLTGEFIDAWKPNRKDWSIVLCRPMRWMPKSNAWPAAFWPRAQLPCAWARACSTSNSRWGWTRLTLTLAKSWPAT